MAVERRVRYSEDCDIVARENLVTKENVICNTRYVGNPKAGAVKIPVLGNLTVKDYNKKDGIDPEEPSQTMITVTIDHDVAVSELIDGYDQDSVPGNLVGTAVERGGFSLAEHMDKDALAEIATKGTIDSNVTPLTATTAYASFVDARTRASRAKVPMAGRYAIVTPETYALILRDDNFVKKGDLSQKLVETGAIGQIAGFAVYESVNLPDGVEYVTGHQSWVTRIEEWQEPIDVKEVRDGKHIGAVVVQGRKIYAHKVTQSDKFYVKRNKAVSTASTTPSSGGSGQGGSGS